MAEMKRGDKDREIRVTPDEIIGKVGNYEWGTAPFPPPLDEIVAGLIDDDNWLREIEQLGEDQRLCDRINFLPGANQKKITYEPQRQYLYHLKYMPFYASEYKEMYQDILTIIPDEQLKSRGIRVCSIGAGNFVDYWALSSAYSKWVYDEYPSQEDKQERRSCIEKLAYLGVDCVEWRYPVSFLEAHKKNCATLFEDIASEEARNQIAEFAASVYFFPKSLNELEDHHIKSVVQAIDAAGVDTVYIALSFPVAKPAKGVSGFESETQSLMEELSACGFSSKMVSSCKVNEKSGSIDGSIVDLVGNKAKDFCASSCKHRPSSGICESGYVPKDSKDPESDLKAFLPMNQKAHMNWQVYECERTDA